jgi:hypothetical protein
MLSFLEALAKKKTGSVKPISAAGAPRGSPQACCSSITWELMGCSVPIPDSGLSPATCVLRSPAGGGGAAGSRVSTGLPGIKARQCLTSANKRKCYMGH